MLKKLALIFALFILILSALAWTGLAQEPNWPLVTPTLDPSSLTAEPLMLPTPPIQVGQTVEIPLDRPTKFPNSLWAVFAQSIIELTAGKDHTCAVVDGGGAKCWGSNTSGQLGDGTTTTRIIPADVSGLNTGTTDIEAGEDHTCAVVNSGVKCWGWNYYGQLGDGTTTNRTVPVDVTGLNNGIVALAAGESHTCALTRSGSVKCWGINDWGQLGDGTRIDRTTPVDVNGLGGVTDITAGAAHTCALIVGGNVKCWGYNGFGQIGYDPIVVYYPTPVDVGGLGSGVTTLTAGAYHNCASIGGISAKCWGNNQYGQLGDNTTTSRFTPVDVSGLNSSVTQLSAGIWHTCVLIKGGGAKCWGANWLGQLGDGTNAQSLVPVDVSGLNDDMTILVTGWDHNCVITQNGGAKCWGIYSDVPVDVVGFSPPIAPSNLQATPIDASHIRLDWDDNSDDETGFEIYDGETVVPVEADATSYIVEGLEPNAYHCYIIRAINNFGYSEVSNWACTTTLTNYAISGRVLDNQGNPVSGVLLSSDIDHSVTTDNNGNYILGNLNTGAYTIVPSKSGYTFSPLMRTVSVPPNSTNQDFTASLNISISHIEVTQGIQDINNDVPLILNKPTFVRVYVDCGLNCTAIHNVTGQLAIFGPSGELIGPPLKPNSPITAYHPTSWEDQRDDSRKTLNFTIPAAWLTQEASLTLTAYVGGKQKPEIIPFKKADIIRVAYIPIHYAPFSCNWSDTNTPNDFRISKAHQWAEQIYPTHKIEYTAQPTLKWSLQLRKGENCLGKQIFPHQDMLLNYIWLMRTLNLQVSKPYLFGWLPDNAMNGGSSLQRERVGIGDDDAIYGQTLFAHEIGHLLGLDHTKAINAPAACENPTPDKPSDWPYPNSAAIDDFGFDGYGFGFLANGNVAIAPHLNTYDYMSYCWDPDRDPTPDEDSHGDPTWTSKFTYRKIFSNHTQSQVAIKAAQSFTTIQPYLLATGLVFTDDTTLLNPFWIITSTSTISNPNVGNQYCLEAQNNINTILASHCFDLDFKAHTTGEVTDADGFALTLPYPDNTARIVLKKGAQELAMQTVSDNAPTLSVLSPNGGEAWSANGTQTITWAASDADGDDLIYSVFYSSDGSDWVPISVGITETQTIVNVAELAGGSEARVRVLATDGVNTGLDDSDVAFTVGTKEPQAYILAPEGDGKIPPGTPLLLQGYGYDLEDGTLDSSQLGWHSDLDGDLGMGEYIVKTLSPGKHTLTLTATDSDSNAAAATITIVVGHQVYLPLVTK